MSSIQYRQLQELFVKVQLSTINQSQTKFHFKVSHFKYLKDYNKRRWIKFLIVL